MKLKFRGISYYYAPHTIYGVKTKVIGHFLGATYVAYRSVLKEKPTKPKLKFRGIAY